MRICLTVSYRGTDYSGWQVQPDARSVQGELMNVVARLCEQPVKVTGASRTDAGVHATGQVCHFDPPRLLPTLQWQRAFDRMLPDDIRVVDCRSVNDDFHARYSAIRKTYRYHVDPAPRSSPLLAQFAWHRPGISSFDDMCAAATALEGTICQRVFASQPEGDRDLRAVDSVSIEAGRLLTFTVVGRSFMRHAVRGMVGTLMEVGYGRRSAAELEAMAADQPGHLPMVKAPAHGLCLVRVDY